MSTNKYFDSLRGDTTEGVLKQYETETEKFNAVRDNLQPITPDPRNMPFYEAAGFQPDPNNQGAVVTASRQLSDYIDQRELRRQQQLSQEYQDTKGSALFRVGDTLADAGRLFLSPLFWLSGEDTTKYDPSAMVDAGYKKQMAYSQDLRTGMYDKLLKARDARQLHMHNLQKDYITNQKNLQDMKSGNSPEQKAMFDFASNTNQLDILKQGTIESYDFLKKQMLVANGDAFTVGSEGRVMMKGVYEQLQSIGTDFKTKAAKSTEAYSGYIALMESLTGAKSGFADIAAVFSFMKALDPRSVVRDSEFKMAAGATGLFDKMLNIEQQVKEGILLPDKARPKLADLAKRLVSHWEDAYKGQRMNAERQITYHSQENADEDILNFLGDLKTLPDFGDVNDEPSRFIDIPVPEHTGAVEGVGVLQREYLPEPTQDQLLLNDLKRYYR